jgi:hypothetical protein
VALTRPYCFASQDSAATQADLSMPTAYRDATVQCLLWLNAVDYSSAGGAAAVNNEARWLLCSRSDRSVATGTDAPLQLSRQHCLWLTAVEESSARLVAAGKGGRWHADIEWP